MRPVGENVILVVAIADHKAQKKLTTLQRKLAIRANKRDTNKRALNLLENSSTRTFLAYVQADVESEETADQPKTSRDDQRKTRPSETANVNSMAMEEGLRLIAGRAAQDT